MHMQDALAQGRDRGIAVDHLDKIDAIQRPTPDGGTTELIAAKVNHGAARSKLSVRVAPVSRMS